MSPEVCLPAVLKMVVVVLGFVVAARVVVVVVVSGLVGFQVGPVEGKLLVVVVVV